MTLLRRALPFLPLALVGCGDGSSGGGPGPMSDAMVAEDSPPPAGAACRFDPSSGTAPVLAAIRQDELHLVLADGTARTIHRIADGLPWTAISYAQVLAAGPRFVLSAQASVEGLETYRRELVGFDHAGARRWELTYEDGGYEAVYPGSTGYVAIARYGEGLASALVDPEGVVTPIGDLQPVGAPSAAGWVPVSRPAGGDARELGWRTPAGEFELLADGVPFDVRWTHDDTLVAVVQATSSAGELSQILVLARPGETPRRQVLPEDAWSITAASAGWALVSTFSPERVYRIDVGADAVEPVDVVLPDGAVVTGAEHLFVPPGPGLDATGALQHALVLDHEVALHRSPDGTAWTRVGQPFTLTPPTTDWIVTPLVSWVERAGTTATFVTESCDGCPAAGTVLVERAGGRTATIEGAATDSWAWDGDGAGVISADGGCVAYFSIAPEGAETLHVLDLGGTRTVELGVMPRLARDTWSTHRPLWLTPAAVE